MYVPLFVALLAWMLGRAAAFTSLYGRPSRTTSHFPYHAIYCALANLCVLMQGALLCGVLYGFISTAGCSSQRICISTASVVAMFMVQLHHALFTADSTIQHACRFLCYCLPWLFHVSVGLGCKYQRVRLNIT